MGLKDLLNAGMSVIGSKYDGKIKPLGQMSETAQRRQGYTDENGYWTDRGYDRATTKDMNKLEAGTKARAADMKKQG